jgi:fumarate hydratase, class II
MQSQSTRLESDSFGEIAVPADHYWGAQTQRSRENFRIGEGHMPLPLVFGLVRVKKIAAKVNHALGLIDETIAGAIIAAADEVLDRQHDGEFPLVVWQTGSGTQSNMNVNEVLAGRANEILSGKRGGKTPVHPNDHVNRGQSSNDSFPTAMHIAAAWEIRDRLIPALDHLHAALKTKSEKFADIIKIGRTHLQDATPVTLGQEISAWAAQVSQGVKRVAQAAESFCEIAQGGTAVGTGLNTHPEFASRFAKALREETDIPFVAADNPFAALASHDAFVYAHGAIDAVAMGLFKIANDVRMLGSGPRAGLGELMLPENEPGSSIMPGKVNPTQAEALTMVCARIHGNHATISFAASQGHLQLNVYKPVIGATLLESIRLLADAAISFTDHCIDGLEPNVQRIKDMVQRSLMLVTALVPVIGYDRAASIAKAAHHNGTTLREEAIKAGVDATTYDRVVRPETMLAPSLDA